LGYVNAPEEQRKRFVVNPHRDDSLDLIYFSGDRGRYLPDGSLEILGRLDDQVKIRGVRVEPDEVTVILSQHPGVRSCFVAARRNEHGETILVGYVVASSDSHRVEVAALRSFLAKALPSAMVPSSFVFLDSLPLTPNGKVDRRALPIPDGDRPELEEAFVAPRTPVEETLAGIWAEVLGVERVGANDNFFELGGHSLLATQVISRVRSAFQIELPLRTLFESPTVAGLAVQIAKVQAQPEELAVILAHLESLSVEEAQRLLADDGESSGKESKHDG
jgi:acyl carrier protein